MKRKLSPQLLTLETSLYVDILRFFAALIVVFSHSSNSTITGGFLWQTKGYAQTAVMIFFVLSGYVIGYVSHTKEKKLIEYSAARIARLYSVVVPAILLTIICNIIGEQVVNSEYKGLWDFDKIAEYGRYIATFFMMQDVWDIDFKPANNGPFWSISFEAIYYVIFAICYYTKPISKKYISLLIVCLIAGPTILVLLPIWGLGYLAFLIHLKCKQVKHLTAYLLFIISLTLLLLSPILRDHFSFEFNTRSSIIGDYIDGIAFFMNLLAAPFIAYKLKSLLVSVKKQIRYLAGLTFVLYLCHLPLLRLLAAISPFRENTHSFLHIIFVLGVTFIGIILVTPITEKLKKTIKFSL